MILHPREKIVREAKARLYRMHVDSELTDGEMFCILSDLMATIAKYMIREERHPDDPDKPGGLK